MANSNNKIEKKSTTFFNSYTLLVAATIGIFAAYKYIFPAAKKVRSKYDANSTPNYKVAILGATGCTGNALVKQLVARDAVQQIVLISRRAIALDSPKVKQIVIPNYDTALNTENEELQQALQGTNVFFNCHGAKYQQEPNTAAIRKIDYDYTVQSGLIAKKAHVPHYYVITSMGSNKDSWFLYPRTKGEIEQTLAQMQFDRFTSIRPSMLLCDRQGRALLLERVLQQLSPLLNMMLVGPLAKYKAIPVEHVARAMIIDAEQHLKDVKMGNIVEIIENDELHEINAKL